MGVKWCWLLSEKALFFWEFSFVWLLQTLKLLLSICRTHSFRGQQLRKGHFSEGDAASLP